MMVRTLARAFAGTGRRTPLHASKMRVKDKPVIWFIRDL